MQTHQGLGLGCDEIAGLGVVEGAVGRGVEGGVEAGPVHQGLMGPLFDDPAGAQDDVVGVADRGQAVGDDQARSAGRLTPSGPLDGLFGEAVDVGGGLVEDEDARISAEALAKEISWRWPIDRLRPRWPAGCRSRRARP